MWNIIGLCIGGGLAGLILLGAWVYEYVSALLDLMAKCDEVEMR